MNETGVRSNGFMVAIVVPFAWLGFPTSILTQLKSAPEGITTGLDSPIHNFLAHSKSGAQGLPVAEPAICVE